MFPKLKARKCRKCKAEFDPKTDWQKFCGARCRVGAQNARRADILRRAQKIIDAQAAGGGVGESHDH
jgi:hypothetical protein